MPNNGYFDIKRDIQIVNDGGFFCLACAVGKPADDQSPDPRYCQGCYDFLLKEVELLPVGRRPAWIPRYTPSSDAMVSPQAVDKIVTPIPAGSAIMSTLGKARAGNGRGRRHKALPVELITQWAGEDMGSKAIASKLNNEHGIQVSYKTIQRILSGEREISN